jgi:hypothetical protein
MKKPLMKPPLDYEDGVHQAAAVVDNAKRRHAKNLKQPILMGDVIFLLGKVAAEIRELDES